MAAYFIFVEGCDTEPAKLPVYMVESEQHASRICEGIKETEYVLYRFSFVECTKSDLSKFPFWAKMTFDAREGVYGNIIGGIYDMIDEAYAIMSGRRIREKYTSGVDTQTATAIETPPGERTEANSQSIVAIGVGIELLRRSERLAYLAAKYAEMKNGQELPDSEAWEWLNENGIGGAGEIDSYKLPLKDTFADYMNRARRNLGEKRKAARGGRTGRSIVTQSET